MSVRIYQLSKEVGMTNKEVICLLQERGLKVDIASNTIPNIYADSFIEEFKNWDTKEKETTTKIIDKTPAPKSKKLTMKPAEAKEAPKAITTLPPGRFVKTAEDIANEHTEKAAAQQPKAAPVLNNPQRSPMPPPPESARGLNSPPKPLASNGGPAGQAPKPEPLPSQAKQGSHQNKAATETVQTPTQDKQENRIQVLHCKPPIVVRDFALLMGIKPFKLISELMEMGIFASMNQTIEEETAHKLAEKHRFLLEIHHRGEAAEPAQQKKKEEKAKIDEPEVLEPRPPIVCVLGHVDHGKTTLLDSIRKANVVSGEAGGITQHIGAYQVDRNKHLITFIDTPGHAAFSKMRQRGANITDIAILVVAADDGFMPQTLEALKFVQKSNVPIVVAINKMDAPGANIERVKQQMQQYNIAPEEWGGSTQCTPVSAIKGENIEKLLELILLEAEMLELKANPKSKAEGVVVESQMEVGRGATASVIVQKGTLKVGDSILCGSEWCRVRAMMDDKGKQVKWAGTSTPVRILGWSGTPEAGSPFRVVKSEKEARALAESCAHETKMRSATDVATPSDLQNLFDAIASTKQKTFKVFIKGDVHGTVEAIGECLQEIKSEKIKLEIINTEVGPISKNDVVTANAANAAIVAFNTKPESGVIGIAKHHTVPIIQHNIIYELIDQVKEAMTEMLEPELKENKLGAAEVRQLFPVSTKGLIAGSMVIEGRLTRDRFARVHRVREQKPIYEGKIKTLKRFKEDVTEVRAGYECGIQLDNFEGIKEGDIIECFEITKIRPSL